MKTWLRKVLTQKQRQEARRILYAFDQFIDKTGTAFLNVWPASWRVYAKSRLSIRRTMDYVHDKIVLDVSSPFEYSVRTRSCSKEPETVHWIEDLFQKDDVLFDVGANVGAYALVAAKYHKGRVRVYAFEPSFLNFSQLCRNITLNDCHGTITAFNVALSGKTGLGTFNYHNLTTGGAMHTLGDPVDYTKETFVPVCQQTVLTYTMDDFIAQFGIPMPQHIKLDVDGIEYQILQGAPKIFSDPRLKSVFVEMLDSDQPMMDHFLSKGFKVHKRFPMSIPGVNVANYIFSRS